MTPHKFSKFIMLSVSASTLALAGCASSGTTTADATKSAEQTKVSSMQPQLKTPSIDRLMEKALADAEATGNTQDALAILDQIHARNPKDPIVATRYARALREDDQINAAVRTLNPFVKGDDKNVEAVTEMAMTQLALGDFNSAETYASQAVAMDDKNARGFLALGTAQDAQGDHQAAEISFRKGLRHWKGDPTPILNNLALNLASQGHLKESLALLEKAIARSPGRMDLERNRRIIATLLETEGEPPVPPSNKPKVETKHEPKKAEVVKPMAKPKTINNLKREDGPTAEELNARAKQTKPSKPPQVIVEQKQPAPPPEVEPAASGDTPVDSAAYSAEDINNPRTKIKNLKLKKMDEYN